MEVMIVRTQEEYNKAAEAYREILEKSTFDLDMGKGNEIVEEVDYLLHNYLHKGADETETEAGLSAFYFTPFQARRIMGFFYEQNPRDMYDIERGLNHLYLHSDKALNVNKSLVKIYETDERIKVYSPVTVHNASMVEAREEAFVWAYDSAKITAKGNARVYAYDKSSVKAYNNAIVSIHNNAFGYLYDSAVGQGQDNSTLYLFDTSIASLYNKSAASADDNSRVIAFGDSKVVAIDHAGVEARDNSIIEAYDRVTVKANDTAIIIAGGKAEVMGKDRTLVITQGHDVVCNALNECRIVTTPQIRQRDIEKTTLLLMGHPAIGRDALKAVNLLLKALPLDEKKRCSQILTRLECAGEDATKEYFTNRFETINAKKTKRRDNDASLER